MREPRLKEIESVQQEVIRCARCPRLLAHCHEVATIKRRMYRDEDYWGRPLPGFGDAGARLLIVGLAPAAHGGNRTGRMFTGDRSGDFLYRALYEKGFSNQPESIRRGDGLQLRDCYITAALRCAPPQNRPAREELLNCRPYLLRELELLSRVGVVMALGRIAFDTYLDAVRERLGGKRRSDFRFAHGASFDLPGSLPKLFASYHPSQQNTQTGRLTAEMFRSVLEAVQRHLA